MFHEEIFPFHTSEPHVPVSDFPIQPPSSSIPLDHTSFQPSPPASFPPTSSFGRPLRTPAHLNDYVCGAVQSTCA